jgi:Phage integrase, N-terminal SAM-like domain
VPAKKTTDGRTPDGKWIDRWMEGSVKRKRTFDRKGDRDAFRDRRRRAQQLGRDIAAELMLDEDLTLNAWVEEWWARHAVPNLEQQTRDSYKQQWGKWIGPRLGSYELRALTPRLVNVQLVQAMRKGGAGEPTVRLSLSVLQSILRLAVTEERIPANPVDLIEKPSSLPDGGLDPIRPRLSRSYGAWLSRAAARSACRTRSSSACSATKGFALRSSWRSRTTTCCSTSASCSSRARTSTASFPLSEKRPEAAQPPAPPRRSARAGRAGLPRAPDEHRPPQGAAHSTRRWQGVAQT